ncbi:hypothetical protein AQV86_04490 [Nanohaloarchaea archaeon SG9]|nr:hypothetical protein AQV86_04490 [Nanohaloarchaea archaeon SG9]
MRDRKDRVKDTGLIKQGLVKRISHYSEETGEEVSEVVSKAYRLGLAFYTVSEEEIPRIDPEDLQEDVFSYSRWQINLYEELIEFYPGIQWAEAKSAFLEKGIDYMED